MASATLTRPRPGQPEAPARRRLPVSWPVLALLGLIIGTTVGFFVRPTYPNYDSYYSLLWGREVLHGTLPSFDAYRAPTEHPLAIAFGAVLALVGDGADRIMVGATFAFQEIVYLVIRNWDGVTKGTAGITGIPGPPPIELTGLPPLRFDSELSYYYLVLAFRKERSRQREYFTERVIQLLDEAYAKSSESIGHSRPSFCWHRPCSDESTNPQESRK